MLLKRLDPISAFIPRLFRNIFGLPRRPNLGCVIRPGGLGDLVVLTRAWLEAGIDIWRMVWIVERRNQMWSDFLRLPSIVYDQPAGLLLAARSREGFDWVVNTEQTFGLASAFACRLTDASGLVFGFSTSRARHLHDRNVPHSLGGQHEIDSFRTLLEFVQRDVTVPRLRSQSWRDGLNLEFPRRSHAVIALGGRQSKERSLPLEDWVKLSAGAAQGAERVYLLGSALDTKFGVELAVAAPWIDFNLVGRVSFQESVSLIASAKRVYAVDSGLVHVADFFATPSSVVFVREDMKIRWAPRTAGSELLMLEELRSRKI